MRCIEPLARARKALWSASACTACLLLGACGTKTPDRAPATAPSPAPVVTATPNVTSAPTAEPLPAPAPTPPRAGTSPPAPAPQVAARPKLGPPSPSRTWSEFRQQAARRLVAANPAITYVGRVPEPLLAIPVLEVELNADGSVKRVQVLRHPTQAKDTTQMAIDAVHRAAPYGDVSRLPKPWKWAEVFLFDDDRRFKPRTLDL